MLWKLPVASGGAFVSPGDTPQCQSLSTPYWPISGLPYALDQAVRSKLSITPGEIPSTSNSSNHSGNGKVNRYSELITIKDFIVNSKSKLFW